MVRLTGIEPVRPKATDFKSVTSTYSVTVVFVIVLYALALLDHR